MDEHKKSSKNGNLQKILLITCKNSSRKPLKSRVPRGYRRNESKPVEGIDTFSIHDILGCKCCRNESKPVEGIDTLLIEFLHFANHSRNESKPVEGIDTGLPLHGNSFLVTVEMKVSPLRALTHDHLFQFTWFYDVEMKVTS